MRDHSNIDLTFKDTRLTTVSVKDFGDISSLEVTLPLDTNTALIVGDSGAGKSLLLESITQKLYEEKSVMSYSDTRQKGVMTIDVGICNIPSILSKIQDFMYWLPSECFEIGDFEFAFGIFLKHGNDKVKNTRDMPAGFRNVFNLIYDMFRRFIRNGCDISDATLLKGLVLIDNIELGLSVKVQRLIVPRLKEFFPNVQFIITTNSPFVAQSLDPKSVIILDNQDGEVIARNANIEGEMSIEVVIEELFGVGAFSVKAERILNQFQELSNKILSEQENENDIKAFKIAKKFLFESGQELRDIAASELHQIKLATGKEF